MRARVSSDDLKAGNLVDAAFYLAKITRYEEKPGKKDPSSTTAHISLTVVCDSNGDEKFKGARSMIFPNEKALGIPPYPTFLVALGAKVTKDGIDANLSNKIVNRYVEVYLSRGKDDNGKENNASQEFAPLGTNISPEILANYGLEPAPKQEEEVAQ